MQAHCPTPDLDLSALNSALERDAQDASGPFTKRYIVVLNEPPLASYRGGIPGLAPTAVDTAGGKIVDGEETIHLAFETDAARAYTDYLLKQQSRMIHKIKYAAPEFTGGNDWQYTNVINGFAGEMTPAHAMQVMKMPGVRLVYPEEELFEDMDSTLPLIGAYDAWEDIGGDENAGLGARVAILEAGNAVNHVFFNDEGMPDPPEGYPSARVYTPDGEVSELGDEYDISNVVNNKTIGFRVFGQIPDLWGRGINTGAQTINYVTMTKEMVAGGALLSGHGTHVSGTVAGRYGTYEILPGLEVEMGGVAPMAQVFNYPVVGGTLDMIKAFEVMAEEEIDAVNLSLGTVTWLLDRPETHPVSVAMSGAADAGVLVVGSSGNAGANGRTSLSGGVEIF